MGSDKTVDEDKTIADETVRNDRSSSDGRLHVGCEILERYVIQSELGRGGMGVVYKCLDKVGGVEVAVKGLPPDVSHNEDEMEEIRDNFQLVCDLRHSAITGVRTLERDAAGDYYLVMDVARGVNLNRWMKAHRDDADLSAKLTLLSEMASALDYAHSRRVMHRDMKPENVMVDDDGHVQILDFGLAARIRTSMSHVSMRAMSMSGTPGYKSPEQWRGQPQGAAADQYALGVIAYKMISGELPFDSEDLGILREAVLKEPVPEIPGASSLVNKTLARALAKTPTERFACCSDFVAVLGGGKATGKAVVSTKKVPSPTPHPARLRTLVTVVLSIAVLAGGGFAAYTWHERKQQEIQKAEDARKAELAAQRAKELEALKNKATEIKGRATAAYEDAAKRKLDAYPELAAALRSFNASYKSGHEAFANGDYASATNFFERTGSAMREMAAEQRRLDAIRAEEKRVAEVKRKIATGGYDAGKDKDGREIAVWAPLREVNGRMTSEREGVWRTKVDCPECKGAGTCPREANCERCSGGGMVDSTAKCLACNGGGKVSRRQVCSLCSGAGIRRTDCSAGCSQITRNGQVLFSHGFVCSQCSGKGTVVNGSGLVGDLAGAAIGAAIFGKSYRPPPPSPTRVTCSQCNGLGGYQCGTCSGTGFVQSRCYACSGGGNTTKNENCLDCSGRGERPVRVQCSSCRNGKVTTFSSCSQCGGIGKVWQEEGDADGGKRCFPVAATWSPVGTWRTEYAQTIANPNEEGSASVVSETMTCRQNGEFSRTRKVNDKTTQTQGKWRMENGLLVLSVHKADGSSVDTAYQLLQRTADSFELRFADVGDYERGLAVNGRKAVSTYRDDGTLATELTVDGRVTTLLQAAKIFKKEIQ